MGDKNPSASLGSRRITILRKKIRSLEKKLSLGKKKFRKGVNLFQKKLQDYLGELRAMMEVSRTVTSTKKDDTPDWI